MTKSYDLPNGRKMTAEFDENGICKITVQALDSLVDELNYYAEQEPKTKWIPVSERLPEEDGLYLVYTEEQPFVCPFEDNGFFIDDVLAWMPLPEPYKEERTEDETDN